MTPSTPTTIVALYRLRPGRREQWLETWQQIASIARSLPECRTFILDSDPGEPNQCRAVSTWSSGSDFDRFVRAIGLPWIERYLDYSARPPRYTRFTLPRLDPVHRQPAHV